MPIMRISKIVSGAQTGADRGGLDAAVHCGLLCGGWVPKGWRAENGRVPAEYLHLGLRETGSKDYAVRTEANVKDSDATVIFTRGELEGGSLKTAEFAHKHLKPCLHVDLDNLDHQKAVDTVTAWIADQCPPECDLNVAGQRESKAPGIQRP